jgi:hypothetical protein
MDKHKRKYENWKRLCPKQTKHMCTLIETEIVPFFINLGFSWVSVSYHDPEWTVSGNEISLERINEDSVDTFSISFNKYRGASFQVSLIRRKKIKGNEFIRSAKLVKKRTEYYHIWCKPWYWPTKIWPNSLTVRAIKKVKSKLSNLVDYIEYETYSQCINQKV